MLTTLLYDNESLVSSSNNNESMISTSQDWKLSPLDWAVVTVYMLISMGLGLWWGCREAKGKRSEDYFLAGKNSPWHLIGLSIFASNISSSTLVGLAGETHAHGIAVFSYEWMSTIVLVLVASFVVSGFMKSGVYTVPEFLNTMYNGYVRYYYAALTVFLNVVVDMGATLYAGAMLLQMLLPGWEMWQVMAVLACLVGFYTVTGGLAAVMATDAAQAILLQMGSILITIFAVQKAGGWRAMMAQQPPGYVSLIRPMDDPSVPWTGLLGVFILALYFFSSNQFMAQRLLSARSVADGQWGALLAGALKLPVVFTMVVPGLAARVLYPDLHPSDRVYPTLMFDLLPPGVLGLVLAGFLAALMSQLDSNLNSVATLVTMDWVRLMKPSLTPTQLRLVGQGMTVVVMVVAVAWAPQIQRFPSLFQYLQQILSYTIPPVVAIYFIGFFWRGATPAAANLTLLLGTVAGLILFLLIVVFKYLNIHFLYVPIILVTLSGLVLVISSKAGLGKVKQDRIALWSWEDVLEENKILKSRPLWQNYRLHSVLLLAATACVVGIYW
ncbi:hypothetical protein Pmani_029807 [Petrolisthes manimaculis]|uniref:Uncharacterized protein n=1 Tax=Petrolisthes manimaculis TaxID=1843537 RepID=A0AAE1NY18_9EUCA|nr:hypothetical protein Pmani_029807 [Petrolisthes manimaculis]